MTSRISSRYCTTRSRASTSDPWSTPMKVVLSRKRCSSVVSLCAVYQDENSFSNVRDKTMANLTRRQFIELGVAVLPAMKTRERLPIAFSTLGCPKWDWRTILKQASELGYAAIELRGIQGEMDLTRRPELSGTRLKESLKDLGALDLRICDLGSSARRHA